MAVRGINKVILVGRLGKDPEVRYIPNGGAVANLQVATSRTTAFSREPEMANRSRQRYWHSGRLKRPSAVKRNAVRMKLSVKWQRTNLTCRTAKQSRLSGILPGWSVTGLPYLNGKPRCRRVYCVNHNGCGKRSGRLPGKICCRSDCSRWSGIWFVTCRKRKPWAETDTGR